MAVPNFIPPRPPSVEEGGGLLLLLLLILNDCVGDVSVVLYGGPGALVLHAGVF